MLGAVLMLTTQTSSAAGLTSFSDVDQYTAYERDIYQMETAGVFKGNDNGTFTPNSTLNRAEMAMLLWRMEDLSNDNHLKIEPLKGACDSTAYPDVEAGSWYEEAVQLAQCKGLMTGDDGGTFRPNDPLTMAEVATVMVRAYSVLTDSPDQWYMAGLEWAEAEQAIPVTTKGLTHEITRAEMARMLNMIQDQWNTESDYNYLTVEELLDGQPDVHVVTPTKKPYVFDTETQDELNMLKQWSNSGLLPDELTSDFPLPWSLEENWVKGIHLIEMFDAEENLISDNQSKDLLPLFEESLFNHYRQSFAGRRGYLTEADWKLVVTQATAGVDNHEWAKNSIRHHGDWVTFPYRAGFVGALNLATGAFVLHEIETDEYSQALADDEGVLYAENNSWGCLTENMLGQANVELSAAVDECHIVYESTEGDVTVFDEILMPFLDGIYDYYLRMNDEHVFLFDTIWECYEFCPPRVAIYDRLEGGEIEHQEDWNYGPYSDNSYVPDAKYFNFGRYTKADGWQKYSIPTENFNYELSWEQFWSDHPELTNPYSLIDDLF